MIYNRHRTSSAADTSSADTSHSLLGLLGVLTLPPPTKTQGHHHHHQHILTHARGMMGALLASRPHPP